MFVRVNWRAGACAITLAAITLGVGGVGGPGPGDLDPSFGDSGHAFIAASGDTRGGKSVLQPDGKIVLIGFVGGWYHADFLVARLTADGRADPSFGSDGVVTTP